MHTSLLLFTFLGFALAQNVQPEQNPAPIATSTAFSPISAVPNPAATTTPAIGRTAPNTAFSPIGSIPNGRYHGPHRPSRGRFRKLQEQREKARKRASIIFGSLIGGLVFLFIVGTGLMCIRRRRIIKRRIARQQRVGVDPSSHESRYVERFNSDEKLPAFGDDWRQPVEEQTMSKGKLATFLAFLKPRRSKKPSPTTANRDTRSSSDLESATLHAAYGSEASLVKDHNKCVLPSSV